MTSLPPSGHADDDFAGPAELAPLWKRFVSDYSQDRTSEAWTGNVKMLSRLAFGDGAAGIVAELQGKEKRHRNVKFGIEHIATALSDATRDVYMRPLHRQIVASLIAQWIALEADHGLYPPPTIASKEGVTHASKATFRKRQETILRTPEGAMLAGALRMLEDAVIRAEAHRVHARYGRWFDYHDVLMAAYGVFDQSLFRYESGQSASFTTYVGNGLKLRLAGRMQHLVNREESTPSGEAPSSMIDESVADHRAVMPFEKMMRGEHRRRLFKILDELQPRDRDVLYQRFGLRDGVSRTCQEIGDSLGISASRVQQLQTAAMKKCFSSYQATYGELPDGIDPTPSPGHRR